MRVALVGLVLTGVLLLANPAATAAPAPVVGFVDIALLIDSSPQAEQALARLESEFKPRQEELTALREQRAEVESRVSKESQDESVDTESEERDLRALERRLQRLEQAFREDLNIKRNSELKSVRNLVLESVATYARQQGFDLILTDGVLYASTSVDITQRVLEQLREGR